MWIDKNEIESIKVFFIGCYISYWAYRAFGYLAPSNKKTECQEIKNIKYKITKKIL